MYCRVYASLAQYKGAEGDCSEHSPVRHEMYLQCISYHRMVTEQLEIRQMDKSIIMAETFDNFATDLRSLGFLL